MPEDKKTQPTREQLLLDSGFNQLLLDTSEGWGYWPDGKSSPWHPLARGTTMKQQRSWAQAMDARRESPVIY